MKRKPSWSLFLILWVPGVSPAWATCVDYGNYVHWLGANPSVRGNDITISGTLAYVAAYDRVQVVDVSNPAFPTLLGSVLLPPTPPPQTTVATGITVAGNLAYVSATYGGLYVINVSNPASPSIVGHADTPWVAEDIAVAGNLAFVADNDAGLQLIDISTPVAPVLIASADTPGKAFGVSLIGSMAYVADGLSGVQVIDVSNPLAPVIVETVATPGAAEEIVAVGSFLYVASGYSGLVVIDASSPGAPILVGARDTPGYAWDLSVSGNRAFVADDTQGVVMIDVTNPSSPTLLAIKAASSTARTTAVSGSTGCFIEATYGLKMFDPSIVDTLFLYGSWDQGLPLTANQIGANGSLVCWASNIGLTILDTSNPLYPRVVNTILLPGQGTDAVIVGTTAYVTFTESTFSGGLLVIDLSNPSDPQELGRLNLPSGGSLAISGTKAFVVAYGHFPDDPGGNESNRLVVIDVADPQNMAILGTVIVTGGGPVISGTMVYLTGKLSQFLGRISVVDVADPAQPMVIGGLDLPGWEVLRRMVISGNYGFVPVSKQNVGADHTGVAKLELMPSPETPRLLEITYTPGGQGGATVSGTTLFAAAGSQPYGGPGGGIYLFDVATMEVIGTVDLPAWNVFAAGGLVYASVGTGFVILPEHCEGAATSVGPGPGFQNVAALGAAFPNPGRNGSTFISFTVSKPGAVTLQVVDASGREVRMLVNDMMEPGERRVEWDGRNARGERVSAGIYIYELSAPGLKAARKLVRLR